jgi:surface protein
MSSLFLDATSFGAPDLTQWSTSRVTDMTSMFAGATSFNGHISTWDVSSVTSFRYMFVSASSFNRDISQWNTSRASTMDEMFMDATAFAADVSFWDVGNVDTAISMVRVRASKRCFAILPICVVIGAGYLA